MGKPISNTKRSLVTPIIVLSKVEWHIVFSDKFNVKNTSRILLYRL